MAILEILQYPDLRLRRKGQQVTDVKSAKVRRIIIDMVTTLKNTPSCAGLAATQLDIEEPPSITIINLPTDAHGSYDQLCLINPKIIKKEGNALEQEGCMSVYPQEIYAKVKRATKIQVTAMDQHGKQLDFTATDYLARCIQHECDHLQGILYLDHLSKLNHSRLNKKIAKLRAI